MAFASLVLVSSVSIPNATAESEVIKGKLTEPCESMAFGGEQMGSFEMNVGKKGSVDSIDSIKIWMKEPPREDDYLVGFMGVGGWPHDFNQALVKVDDYKYDGKVMVVSGKVMPRFGNILFVAQHTTEENADRYWPNVDIVASAYLVPAIESFPESNQFEHNGATIKYVLEIERQEYKTGEVLALDLKPKLINTGNESVIIVHGNPLFFFDAYTLDGKPVWIDSGSVEEMAIQPKLEPGVPYSYIRFPHVKPDYPYKYGNLGITFCIPGEYKIVSYAEFSIVERAGTEYSTVENVKLYAEPMTIKVKSLDKRIDIEVEDKQYMISVFGSDKVQLLEFNKEVKEIMLLANSEKIQNVNITLPKELLGGPYSLSMKQEGMEVKGVWMIKQNETHASFSRDLPIGATTISITGTTVIPEFAFAIIIASAAIGVLLTLMRVGKLSKGISFG